jgi:hypothetical protein
MTGCRESCEQLEGFHWTFAACAHQQGTGNHPPVSSLFSPLFPHFGIDSCHAYQRDANRHPHPWRRGWTSLANDKSLPPHVSGHIEADHRSCHHRPQSPSFTFLSSVVNLSPRWTALSKI